MTGFLRSHNIISSPQPSVLNQAVPVMPTPDDAAVQAAKRRALAQQMSRSGRQSTILTQDNSNTLGG